MRIAIVPTPIASAGAKTHGVAEDVGDARRQVAAAWDDAAAARLSAFATYHALDTYTDTFTKAVDKLSTRVHDDGVKLSSTANTVTNHDGAGGDRVGHSMQHTHPYQG